jgi:hypothetical protein
MTDREPTAVFYLSKGREPLFRKAHASVKGLGETAAETILMKQFKQFSANRLRGSDTAGKIASCQFGSHGFIAGRPSDAASSGNQKSCVVGRRLGIALR